MSGALAVFPQASVTVRVAVGPAGLNVPFVNVADALHPVAALMNVKVTVGEQTLGVTEKPTVCCPLTSLVVTPPTVPPEALIVNWPGLPVGKRLVPMTVTGVAVPPAPELGVGPLVMVGTVTVNVPGALAVSPSARRVTEIVPPLLGHPAGGFARICVPVTEITVP